MYGLIQALYDSKRQEDFISLYGDSTLSEQMLLRATIAEALKDCPKILSSHGSDWVLCTLATYHKSPDDTARVFSGLMRKLDRISFGMLTEEIKWKKVSDIADDCLVGLSFFRRHMEVLHSRRAAPPPEYYKEAGGLAFHRLGYESISEDFDGWVSFIEKEMATTSIV